MSQTPPVPPSQVSELPIPKEFDTILMTCLEKNPANRFSSALELDAQLADVPTSGALDAGESPRVVADACSRTPGPANVTAEHRRSGGVDL